MTILGAHTAHELSDLLDAKVHDVAAYADNVSRANTSAPGWAAWLADWQSFLEGWGPVADTAAEAVASGKASWLGWDTDTEEDAYQSVLVAIHPLDDLARRWTFGTFTATPTPQPTAPDADLGTLNAINTIPGLSGTLPNPFASSTGKLIAAGAAAGIVAVLLLKRAL